MKNLVCNGCSLLCDDVSADVEGDEVKSLGLCRLGHAHLCESLKIRKSSAIIRNGEKDEAVSVEDALKQTSELLQSANQTLLYGWTTTSNESIKEGLSIAENLGGVFASPVSQGLIQALSHDLHSGKLEIDLEYVRNNGEFVIYWGTDPTESLHRHPSRFAVLPRGENIPEGIESRTIGVVDVRETETMKMANHRLIISIGGDRELLDAVAAEVSGKSTITGPIQGISAQELLGLVRGLQNSDCTVIFYGRGIVNSGKAEDNLTAISKLLDAIRASGKKAFALPMFPESNAMGVVQFASEKLLKNPSTIQDLVEGNFDTALVVGDDALAMLPGPAAKAIAKTNLIYIGSPGTLTDKKAKISIYSPDVITGVSNAMVRIDNQETEFGSWTGVAVEDGMSVILSKLNGFVKK
jgi:formylmethanofuran dehydrogenase subunit B